MRPKKGNTLFGDEGAQTQDAADGTGGLRALCAKTAPLTFLVSFGIFICKNVHVYLRQTSREKKCYEGAALVAFFGNREGAVGRGCWLKYGCRSASRAVMRLAGSKASMRLSKSSVVASAALKNVDNGVLGCTGKRTKSGNADIPGQSASEGVPSERKMAFNWLMSESPAKKGTRSINSAKMHPAAHMSTAAV